MAVAARPALIEDAKPPGVITRHDVRGDIVVDCDVVVIGSGAGGAPIAAELAEAGFDVVVVEEGSYYATREAWQKAMTQGGASIPGAWMWRQKQDSRSVSFQCGRDDLNHVDVRADRKTGAITITGEH